MPLGEKLFEEEGRFTSVAVKTATAAEVMYEISFASEVQGFGRFPGGRNMGTISSREESDMVKNTGQGIFVAGDGEAAPWHLSSIGKEGEEGTREVSLVTFDPRSQKLAWLKGLLVLAETIASNDLSTFSTTGYEWK